MSWLSSGVSGISNAVNGFFGGARSVLPPYVNNLLTNPSKTLTVQNTYQGQVPGINQINFNPALGSAQQRMGNSYNNTGDMADIIANNAGMQAQLAQGYAPIGAQQGNVAGNIGSLAGNISSLGMQGQNVLGQQQALQGAQQGLYGQQQGLAAALQAQAMGYGPNPAQAQYQQNINQAAQQAAGTIASQKGINPAIAAQLVAQQQGSAQQNAAGQAATLQAQQQLAAESALQNQQGAQLSNLANQGQTLNSQLGTLQGIGGLYGAAGSQYGNQANVLGAQGETLGSQIGAFQGAGNTYGQAGNLYSNQGALANQYYNSTLAAQAAQNQAINQGSLGAQNISASAAAQNAKQTEGTQSGFINALGGGLGQSMQGGSFLGGFGSTLAGAKGGRVPQDLKNEGGHVPGKAKKPGNSPENDTVDAKLSPGEIVIPRSIVQSPDAAKKAAEFVAKLKAKSPSYGDVVSARKRVEKTKRAA